MKNSDKFKYGLLVFIGIVFLFLMGITYIIGFVLSFIGGSYVVFNLYVLAFFPLEKSRFELRNETDIQKECKDYIKNANWELITITYWWCRFLYYLDYEFNQKQTHE